MPCLIACSWHEVTAPSMPRPVNAVHDIPGTQTLSKLSIAVSVGILFTSVDVYRNNILYHPKPTHLLMPVIYPSTAVSLFACVCPMLDWEGELLLFLFSSVSAVPDTPRALISQAISDALRVLYLIMTDIIAAISDALWFLHLIMTVIIVAAMLPALATYRCFSNPTLRWPLLVLYLPVAAAAGRRAESH